MNMRHKNVKTLKKELYFCSSPTKDATMRKIRNLNEKMIFLLRAML